MIRDDQTDGIDDVINIMRLLADPTRFRVITMLQTGEINVSSLCKLLSLAQPTVSHHLGLLRAMGLVNTRRKGKQVFYSLNSNTVESLTDQPGLVINAGSMQLRLTGTGNGSPLREAG